MLAPLAALALASFAASAGAQSIPDSASALDLRLVSEQYDNSDLDEDGNAGFGIELDAKALLTVVYPGAGVIENGQAYDVNQVGEQPQIYVTPSQDTVAWFNSSSRYTLALADASSLGDPDSEGNYRHYLANGLTGEAPTSGNLTFTPEGGNVVTNYAAPGPIAGTGPHRYAWLMFAQPGDFTAPSNLSSSGVAPSHWYVENYVEETGLQLVAASFFTVQNGEPTGSVASTQPVDTATLSVSSMASSASSGAMSTGSMTRSASQSGSSSGTAPTASQSAGAGGSNGAASLTFSLGAGALGLVGAAAVLL
ncbi:phosphatidylethanolamine-binding protein [Rhodotorula diobovata]|uniref:Phosphatidylethanolamine-binding protein n=1 Tax=Rhodotorula diobovata TaxID=5288 RepID=A0A5C5FVY6_9BASI|nr:phosphatidylethanolamine-binding protein [Rhodotorula diobovata]